MGSPSPSSPVTQTTQISQMDPRLYQWLYGTANSPGRQQIANAAMLGKTMQGVQNADPTALAAYYNVPKGTDLAQFQSHTGAINPGQVDPGLAQFPGKSVTPQDYYKEATAGEKKGAKDPVGTAIAAEGGELDVYATGGKPKAVAKPKDGYDAQGNLTQDGYNFLQNKVQSGGKVSPKYKRQMQAYEKANPAQADNTPTGNTPLSLADAQIGVTPFYDPATMQSTNPYYNQAVDVLKGMGNMPSQYGQAGDVYSQVAQGLLGQTSYQPQQVSARDIEAAKIGRGDIRDIAAQQAQVERYNATHIAPTVREQGVTTTAPKSWTDPGVAQQYMSPYAQAVIDQTKYESNRDFLQNLNAMRGGATKSRAYGGTRQAMQDVEAARGQNRNLANIQAQGLNQAYGQGMGQFQAEQGLGAQVGMSNTAQINQLKQQYMSMGLTEAQANQAAQNAASQFGASAQNQAYNNYVAQQLAAQQANQGMDWNVGSQNATMAQQAALANQQAQLQAQIQNQQAGLSAQGLNLQAYNQAGQAGQGLLGVGQGMGAYNQNLMQNWGAAGNTLQNLAQGYYNQRQQSAQNIWGGVNTATQPATGTLLGSPWGTSYQGQYQQRKKGGKLSIKV